MKPANTAETQALFTPLDWLLSIGMALTWGSSFLLIKIAIRHFDSSVIPLGRTAFGAAALLLIPSARKHIAREHWPRLLRSDSFGWHFRFCSILSLKNLFLAQ
jgi:drug/metabolite transporter (DMT)-like permease